jgi:hypothetical protein
MASMLNADIVHGCRLHAGIGWPDRLAIGLSHLKSPAANPTMYHAAIWPEGYPALRFQLRALQCTMLLAGWLDWIELWIGGL